MTNLDKSRESWRASEEYKLGLQEVERWSGIRRDFSPDLNNLRAVARELSDIQPPECTLTPELEDFNEKGYDPETDLKTYTIQWKYDEGELKQFTAGGFKGQFPDQRLPSNKILPQQTESSSPAISPPPSTTVASLGAETGNLLYKKHHEHHKQYLRYFHFPANNMMVGTRHFPSVAACLTVPLTCLKVG